jgi:hypothetical protein
MPLEKGEIMIWKAWSFITDGKISRSSAILSACLLITACNQTNISNTTIHDDRNSRGDHYLKDMEIKSLIENKLLLTEDDINYNRGTLFYPNGTGIIFSEGTIKIKYSVFGENLCIIGRHSYCCKIKKVNNYYFRITTKNNKIVADKLEIRPFIR